jgi:hypothetical protein
LRMRKLSEFREARIRHSDDAEIRVNRAERIIRRLRFTRAGDGVEKCRFADVWQSNNSGAQHKRGR